MHASYNVPTRITIYGTFMLYKRISEQYVDQDILNYVRELLPEEIVKKTTIEGKEGFKKDFMRWTPKDPNCDRCYLPMAFQYIKEIHGI